MTIYAHSLPGDDDRSRWEPMAHHEHEVAARCRQFLERIDLALGDWGEVLGRWHDLGKYSDRWQAYIRGEISVTTDHKTAGARHAELVVPQLGRLLAYVIAGHHGGLPDWSSRMGDGLEVRLDQTQRRIEPTPAAPDALLQPPRLQFPALPFDHTDAHRRGFQVSMVTRACFSALCDADFLATEAFVQPGLAKGPGLSGVPLTKLAQRLATHLDELGQGSTGTVAEVRWEVRQAARDAAALPPGLFSLNVPTGGGKTLASLEFALAHALEHGLERVVYAIPFTSIIEQTASVFRDVFRDLDPDAVLEYHSNFDPAQESLRSRLAAENFDAPLVVTTNVQFFECLYAAQPSRARKVHRLARSVIILDEAQTLPVRLLAPCLAVLREVCAMLGSTVVLCTATQPAVTWREDFPIGLKDVRPIINDPRNLHQRMKRVRCKNLGRIEDEALVERLTGHDQLLAITNTRGHAATLYRKVTERLGSKGVYHLSTLMCPAHRQAVLRTLRKRLDAGRTCRVISTQLIEAGVDVDFPAVYRAVAGLDSIAQAAGRCNREGKREAGEVYLFDPDLPLRGLLAQSVAKGREVLSLPVGQDPLSLEAVDAYFRLHTWQQGRVSGGWDDRQVMTCLNDSECRKFDFRAASDRFQMIEETTVPLFVPWREEGQALEAELRRAGEPDWKLIRRLQRYSVPIYETWLTRLAGDIDSQFVPGVRILINSKVYDGGLGLDVNRAGLHDPESLIV